jgi:hypothetical protein
MHGGSKIDQSFIDKYSNRENADQTADFSTASTQSVPSPLRKGFQY